MKNISACLSSITLILTSVIFVFNNNISVQAQTRTLYPTNWINVNKSLTDLLNDGWNIVSQSSYRVVTTTPNGAVGIDESRHLYTISKNGKFITCFLDNPKTDIRVGATSGCRLLN
jgi:hypothetical protein